MGYRSEELKQLTADFLAYHSAWAEDPNRPNPDGGYWDSVNDLLAGFGSGSIPGDCRAIADAVAALRVQVEIFDDRPSLDPYPQEAFWGAVAGVIKATQRSTGKTLPPLESVATLRAQQVTDSQIAKIWGFVNHRGEPMPWLVQAELDKPGSVTATPGAVDGRDWRDPRIEPGQEADDVEDTAVARKSAAAAADAKPCPESPRELYDQRVSIAQAAKMLKQPADVIAGMWSDFEAEDVIKAEELELSKAQAMLSKGSKGKPSKAGA